MSGVGRVETSKFLVVLNQVLISEPVAGQCYGQTSGGGPAKRLRVVEIRKVSCFVTDIFVRNLRETHSRVNENYFMYFNNHYSIEELQSLAVRAHHLVHRQECHRPC